MLGRENARGGRARILWLLPIGLALAGAFWWASSRRQVEPTTGNVASEPGRGGLARVPGEATTLAIDAWKLQRAAISGTVRDAKGQAIAGAQVCALTSSTLLDAGDTWKPPCVATGRDGHYRLEGLWPVRYLVSGSAPGHVPAFHVRGESTAKFDAVELRAGAEMRDVDITLQGGAVEIRGVVKDLSGGAVEGAIVTSGGVYYGTGMAVTTSGAEGEFSLWVRPGSPQVWARAEGYAGGSDGGAAPGHQFELFLTPEAVLIGKVVRVGDGAPVEGARVTATRGDTFFGGSNGGAITDAQGQFRLAQLMPGAYKASAEADDAYGMAAEQVVLGLGETSAPIVIEAHPAALVEGKVVIAGGVACPDGSIGLDSASGRQNAAEVEADGLVRMRGLLPGTYAVAVRCTGFVSAEKYEPVVVEDKAITGLRWEVTPGRAIRGTVASIKGEPAAGISVVARGKADPARPGARSSNPLSVETDARGRFEIAGVLPGKYDLRAFAMTGGRATPDKSVDVTVLEGQDLEDIRIEMLAAGEVRGEVRDVEGKPVARAQVSLQTPGRRGATAMTGDDGSFHMREAVVGAYRAMASRDGVSLRAPGTGDDDLQGVEVVVEADAVATVKLVVETGGGKIDGVVRDGGGGVVSDAFVEVDRESESAVGPGAKGPRWFAFKQRPRLTDADGRFTIEALFPGKYTVRALRRGGGEATVEHVTLGAEVTLTIAETGRIAGSVALTGGGAPQEFTTLLEDTASGFRRSDQFFRTGGAWSFAEVPPGKYTLQITAPEGTKSTEVSLDSGEEKAGLRIELAAKVKLRGTVVDLEGAPVVGATVHLGQSGTFTFNGSELPRTDAAGRFEIAGAPVGNAMIRVSGPRGSDEYSSATISTRITGGPEVELPPIRLARQKVKPGETIGDLGFAIKLAAPMSEPAERPIEVALVRPGGAAGAAGLRVGDVIVSVDGADVTGERRYLYESLTRLPAGTLVRLGLARGVTVEVTTSAPP
jgi:protocatechuate 3,4-dioxygenase beta subunit